MHITCSIDTFIYEYISASETYLNRIAEGVWLSSHASGMKHRSCARVCDQHRCKISIRVSISSSIFAINSPNGEGYIAARGPDHELESPHSSDKRSSRRVLEIGAEAIAFCGSYLYRHVYVTRTYPWWCFICNPNPCNRADVNSA